MNKRPLIAVLVSTLAFCGSAVAAQRAVNSDEPARLEDIQSGPIVSDGADKVPEELAKGIRENAMAYGARAGLAHRTYEIHIELMRWQTEYDTLYNFQPLILAGNILPPVIVETDEVYDQQAADLLRIVGVNYRILSQARFTYAPPSWRTYMYRTFSFDPKTTIGVVLKTPEQRAMWSQFVEEGYRIGVSQADEMLRQDLARLQRDFLGMTRYRTLLAHNKVTSPFLAVSRTGITGNKNQMNVDEAILRITAMPEFIKNPDEWTGMADHRLTERLKKAAEMDEGRVMTLEVNPVVSPTSRYSRYHDKPKQGE